MRINTVQDIVKSAAQEMRKYKLVRNATEERLHKRIAELEVTLLAMFSQTARHAGVEEARLIDPTLCETSPSRARLRVYSPSSFPNRPHEGTPSPYAPVKLSQSQSESKAQSQESMSSSLIKSPLIKSSLDKSPPTLLSPPTVLSSPRPAGHEIVLTPTALHELEHARSSGLSPLHTPSNSATGGSSLPSSCLPMSLPLQTSTSLPLQTIGSPRSIVISTPPPPHSTRQGASWALGDPATASSITQGILSSVTTSLFPAPTWARAKGASTSGIGLLLEKRENKVMVKDIAKGINSQNS